MATGKSTVGRKLANRFGWSFFDLDVLVEKVCIEQYGIGISALIERGDEALFRLLERTVMYDLLDALEGSVIVSLGGGTLHNKELGDWLEEHTSLIVLQASWTTVSQRIHDSQRPLKMKARTLFTNREKGYQKGHQVEVDLLDVNQVVDALETWLQRQI